MKVINIVLGVLGILIAVLWITSSGPMPRNCDGLFGTINADIALYNKYNEAAADMMTAGYDIIASVNGPLGTEDWAAFNRGVDAYNAAVDRTIALEERLVSSQDRVWNAYAACVGS